MRNIILPFLLLAFSAYGQQTSVAVLPSEGTLSNDENGALTDEMREAALKVLPTNAFILLKQDVVVKRLGGAENYIKECSESSCIVDLGKKAQVDYVAQASVGKLGNEIRLKVELYNVRTEGLVGMFNDEAENFKGLLAIVKKRAPAEVFGKMPGASVGSRAVSPLVAGGISGLQISSGDYEVNGGKRYLASIASDPEGASLSFNGIPDAHCTKTPCSVEFGEGSVRIIANLEQYEMADTTVSINRNKQSINIRMKPNFGVLEIKPAYQDGIGKDKDWSLTINGKPYYSSENRFSPGNYSVNLSHECYENISFKAGINKGSREVFDMASHIALKKGGLDLSTEVDDKLASEPVFVNGKHVGETPFSGSVPVCAKVEIGKSREAVDVKLKYKEKVKYTHKVYAANVQEEAANYYKFDNNAFGFQGTGNKSKNDKNTKESLYDKVRFGFGGSIGIFVLPDNIFNDVIFNDVYGDTIYPAPGLDFSLGFLPSFPIVSKLTFNPEFYLTYRYGKSDGCGDEYECTYISELALNIPVLLKVASKSLSFLVTGDSERDKIPIYFEGGVQWSIPLYTRVDGPKEYQMRMDRNSYDLGFVIGLGFEGDNSFGSLGVRFFFSTTDYDKNVGNSWYSTGGLLIRVW